MSKDASASIDHKLDIALRLLAEWCVAVDNDSSWDGWDDCYKTAMYKEGPLRADLDRYIAEARARY